MEGVGVVIIGRNEGDRLRRCLASGIDSARLVVYVDSGSSDQSVALASQMGANVVELDRSVPFSAARARNAGFERLTELANGLDFVQFVDGDCEIARGWLNRAVRELKARSEIVAVCGRLRERCPAVSIYNRLCDMEWNGPAGDISACGGIAMYRASSFRQVGGFDPSVTAGEEAELCLRLRQRGGKIVRLPDEMGCHDAAMTRFGQWWKRSVRTGYAFAQNAVLHGRSLMPHAAKEVRSIWFWGLLVPVLALALAWPTGGWSLLLAVGYALLGWRIYRHMRRRGFDRSDARLFAFFCVLCRFSHLVGVLRFRIVRWRGKPPQLIEYKHVPGVSATSTSPSKI